MNEWTFNRWQIWVLHLFYFCYFKVLEDILEYLRCPFLLRQKSESKSIINHYKTASDEAFCKPRPYYIPHRMGYVIWPILLNVINHYKTTSDKAFCKPQPYYIPHPVKCGMIMFAPLQVSNAMQSKCGVYLINWLRQASLLVLHYELNYTPVSENRCSLVLRLKHWQWQ